MDVGACQLSTLKHDIKYRFDDDAAAALCGDWAGSYWSSTVSDTDVHCDHVPSGSWVGVVVVAVVAILVLGSLVALAFVNTRYDDGYSYGYGYGYCYSTMVHGTTVTVTVTATVTITVTVTVTVLRLW